MGTQNDNATRIQRHLERRELTEAYMCILEDDELTAYILPRHAACLYRHLIDNGLKSDAVSLITAYRFYSGRQSIRDLARIAEEEGDQELYLEAVK